MTILVDVLDQISRAFGEGEERMTRVAAKVNIPYDRFVQYIEELRARGLISQPEEGTPRLTAEGRRVLESYRLWAQTVEAFGLASPRDSRPVNSS